MPNELEFHVNDLDTLDWHDPAKHTALHPMKLRISVDQVFDLETGVVVAHIVPGYKFYWGHRHLHVAPADWPGYEQG